MIAGVGNRKNLTFAFRLRGWRCARCYKYDCIYAWSSPNVWTPEAHRSIYIYIYIHSYIIIFNANSYITNILQPLQAIGVSTYVFFKVSVYIDSQKHKNRKSTKKTKSQETYPESQKHKTNKK